MHRTTWVQNPGFFNKRLDCFNTARDGSMRFHRRTSQNGGNRWWFLNNEIDSSKKIFVFPLHGNTTLPCDVWMNISCAACGMQRSSWGPDGNGKAAKWLATLLCEQHRFWALGTPSKQKGGWAGAACRCGLTTVYERHILSLQLQGIERWSKINSPECWLKPASCERRMGFAVMTGIPMVLKWLSSIAVTCLATVVVGQECYKHWHVQHIPTSSKKPKADFVCKMIGRKVRKITIWVVPKPHILHNLQGWWSHWDRRPLW